MSDPAVASESWLSSIFSPLLGNDCSAPQQELSTKKATKKALPRHQLGIDITEQSDPTLIEPTYPPPGGLGPVERARKHVLADAARIAAAPLANQHLVIHVTRYGSGVEPLTVSVAECGDPAGLPVFVFYGVGASRYFCLLFDEEAKKLGLRLISPDRPGYGVSTPWPERDMRDWGDIVEQVAVSLGVGRFGVLGHSSGGAHAFAVAAHEGLRDRIVGMTVLAGFVPVSAPDVPLTTSLAPWLPGYLLRGVSGALPMRTADTVNDWPQLMFGSEDGMECLEEKERDPCFEQSDVVKALIMRGLVIKESQRQGREGFQVMNDLHA
jgi:pimeloyl-ACP methyl ester carboxylesterase